MVCLYVWGAVLQLLSVFLVGVQKVGNGAAVKKVSLGTQDLNTYYVYEEIKRERKGKK